jgi:hypothetical protein
MSRVKIQKLEIWENDLPAVCMVCGQRPAQTKRDTTAVRNFLPFLGLLGEALSTKKVPFPVVTCNECKHGYDNEANMTKFFGLLYTIAFFTLFYPVSTREVKDAIIPVIFYISVIMLHTLYFWTIGKKYAIRCVGMDHGTVSMEFPGGHWGVVYTKYKGDKADRRLGRAPAPAVPQEAPAYPTPGSPPAADDAPLPPAAPRVMSAPPQAFDDEPPPPGAPKIGIGMSPPTDQASAKAMPEPTTGGGGIPMEGDGNGRIPPDLPEFLAIVKEGDTDRVSDIAAAGGDIKEALPNGMNGLHIACIAGLMQMADLLIRRGIDPNCEMEHGLTPMHLAVQSNNQGMVGLLLSKKANPNHKNHQGRTPLHWCAAVRDSRLDSNNRMKMAQVLVRGGGDITVTDVNGKTPADLGVEGGEGKVAGVFT